MRVRHAVGRANLVQTISFRDENALWSAGLVRLWYKLSLSQANLILTVTSPALHKKLTRPIQFVSEAHLWIDDAYETNNRFRMVLFDGTDRVLSVRQRDVTLRGRNRCRKLCDPLDKVPPIARHLLAATNCMHIVVDTTLPTHSTEPLLDRQARPG